MSDDYIDEIGRYVRVYQKYYKYPSTAPTVVRERRLPSGAVVRTYGNGLEMIDGFDGNGDWSGRPYRSW